MNPRIDELIADAMKYPSESTTVFCRRCPNRADLPANDGKVDIANMAGWSFTTETGWLCIDCRPETPGEPSGGEA